MDAAPVIRVIAQTLDQRRPVPLSGIGTLIAQTVPAHVDRVAQRVLPPSVTIMLIPGEATDRAEVVARLAADLSISPTKADALWVDTISEWRFELRHDRTIALPGLGQLSRSVDGRIRFAAAGRIADTAMFGLEVVAAQPIASTGKVIKLPALALRKAARYAAAAAILAFCIWVPMRFVDSGTMQLGLHRLPGMHQPEATFTPRAFQDILGGGLAPTADPFATAEQIFSLDLSGSGHVVYVKKDSVPAEIEPIVADAAPVIRESDQPERTTTQKVVNTTGSVLVVGEYDSRAEADFGIEQLKAMGLDARYAGSVQRKHLVSGGSFNSRVDANENLELIATMLPKARLVGL